MLTVCLIIPQDINKSIPSTTYPPPCPSSSPDLQVSQSLLCWTPVSQWDFVVTVSTEAWYTATSSRAPSRPPLRTRSCQGSGCRWRSRRGTWHLHADAVGGWMREPDRRQRAPVSPHSSARVGRVLTLEDQGMIMHLLMFQFSGDFKVFWRVISHSIEGIFYKNSRWNIPISYSFEDLKMPQDSMVEVLPTQAMIHHTHRWY